MVGMSREMSEQPKSETLKKWEERQAGGPTSTETRPLPLGRDLPGPEGREWDLVPHLSDSDIAVLRAALPIIERLVG